MISNDPNSRLELVAEGLAFPTSLTFDEAGVPYVAEAGLPFGGAAPGGWEPHTAGRKTTAASQRPHIS